MSELADQVAAVPAWYHAMDLPGGIVTPGYYDARPVLDRLPWPDVRGLRCLDVGTYDGLLAFELERRGAADVVAVDVPDPGDWDWPPGARERGVSNARLMAGPEHAPGFEVARRALESRVVRESMTVYDISPERLGHFDVVVCGALLLHLRDPLRALEAIAGVCRRALLSVEEVRLALSPPWSRGPVAEISGDGELLQWMVPGVQAHRKMLYSAGFSVDRTAGPFAIGFGPGHPAHGSPPAGLRERLRRRLQGGPGVPHAAVLGSPRL